MQKTAGDGGVSSSRRYIYSTITTVQGELKDREQEDRRSQGTRTSAEMSSVYHRRAAPRKSATELSKQFLQYSNSP